MKNVLHEEYSTVNESSRNIVRIVNPPESNVSNLPTHTISATDRSQIGSTAKQAQNVTSAIHAQNQPHGPSEENL